MPPFHLPSIDSVSGGRLQVPNAAQPRSRAFGVVVRVCVVALWLVSCETCVGQFPSVGLRSISQSVFAPGATAEVHVTESTHGDEISALQFSHPSIHAELLRAPAKPFASSDQPNSDQARYGYFQVTIGKDVPEGRYEVRAVGRYGISNPRSILIRKDTEVVRQQGNDPANATAIEVGKTYYSTAVGRSRSHYALAVSTDQPYWLEFHCRAIDSPIIASVQVIDSKGKVLLNRIAGDQADFRVALPTVQNQTLYFAISDALYRGGAAYGYAFRIDKQENLGPLPDLRQVGSISVAKVETGSTAESPAQQISLPASIEGTFESADDVDRYICQLEKGVPMMFDVASQRLGEPTDVRLIVERSIKQDGDKTTWQRVATAEDSQGISDSIVWLTSSDPVLTYTAAETGPYRIVLADLDRGESLGRIQRYRLTIGKAEDRWSLLAYHAYPHKDPNASRPSGVHLPRGGSTTVRVFAVRTGKASPIKVSIDGLPPGLSCRPAWIAANQSVTDLTITADPDAPAGQAKIRVVGQAESGEDSAQSEANYASLIWERDGYRPAPVVSKVNSLWVSVTDLDSSPISISTANGEVIEVAKGQKAKVAFKVTRTDSAKDNLVIRARNLPPGVKVGDVTVNGDKTEGEWTIDVTGGAQPGMYSLWGQGETKVKFAFNPQSLERVTAYRDRLKTLRADPKRSADHAKIDQAIADAEKQVAAIKKQTAAKDITVYIPTPLITLKVK